MHNLTYAEIDQVAGGAYSNAEILQLQQQATTQAGTAASIIATIKLIGYFQSIDRRAKDGSLQSYN